MSADVLAASPSGSYAYKDSEGNFYRSGHGLSYEGTVTPPAPAGEVDATLDYNSDVNTWGGEWTLSAVVVNGNAYTANAGALEFEIKMTEDPSELVDGPAYIHNRVWNLTGYLTFGVDSINDELGADDIENYKGSTSWEDFPQGKVMSEGQWYSQPGPAVMNFKDVDDYGLYLDLLAGVTEEVDTMNKKLIIGQNAAGQILLGFSEENLHVPGTEGEFVYVLVFDKK